MRVTITAVRAASCDPTLGDCRTGCPGHAQDSTAATLPTPSSSATIERGAVTNRVRGVTSRTYGEPTIAEGRPRRVRIDAGYHRDGTRIAERDVRYYKDPTTRGRKYKVTCVSLPVDDLAAMDAFAEQHKMARSHLIRAAIAAYIAAGVPS